MKNENFVTTSPFISKNQLSLKELQNLPVPDDFFSLTGPLPYRPTNDALFHMLLEANPAALKSFLCSLLHKKPEEIRSIELRNPINFGKSLDARELIMDVKITLNNDNEIDIEMQVAYFSYWRERSISYLCRCYDAPHAGHSYREQHTATHIGILNFNLPGKKPAFFSSFHFADDKTHEIYSDKVQIAVLQLVHRDLATPEDKLWHLDEWADFFKATTWEEVFALSKNNEAIASLARTLYYLSQDEQVRYLCEQRLESERTRITYEEDVAIARQLLEDEMQKVEAERQKAEAERQKAEQAEQKAEHAEQRLSQAEQQLAKLLAENAALREQLAK